MLSSRTRSLLFAALLLPTGLLAQAPDLPAPTAAPPVHEFAERRAALLRDLAKVSPNGNFLVLVRGNAGTTDMGAFVQDQDFLYLTGVSEPGLAMLIGPGPSSGQGLDELLVPPFSRFEATWNGDFLAPGEEAAKRTGFGTVGNVRNLKARLDQLLVADEAGARPVLYTLTQAAPRLGSTPWKASEVAATMHKDVLDGRSSREEALVENVRATYQGLTVSPLEPFLLQLRAHKSAVEIELLRRSSYIAGEGIAEAMKCARPGVYEFQLAAAARYVFSLYGAGPDAYAAIVGGGPNGCVLHYMKNDRQLSATDLIVMDYAPTLQGYASDVTRTFPANGKFSPEQKKLVQDIHDIQQALIAEVKPGAKLSELGRQCQQMLQARGYRYDHGPSHHVGLAVHDPSIDELSAGMVITVEPGAYLRDKGMGCRIEDTVLVTDKGCEVLSANVPSTPEAIEALMQQKGMLEVKVGTARPSK